MSDDARFDFFWPPGDGGFAHAPFPGAAFALGQEPGGTARQLFDQPGTVVACEEDQGVFREIFLAQRVQHLPDAPIEFFHGVAVETARAFAFKIF